MDSHLRRSVAYDGRIILRFDQDGGNYTLQSLQYRSLITSRLDGRQQMEMARRESCSAARQTFQVPPSADRSKRWASFLCPRSVALDNASPLRYFAMQSEFAMNDLHKALGEISSIRRQVARTTEFRGYGPATLAATSLFAVVAAGLQARWVPDPASHISVYLGIWIVTAAASVGLIGMQMYARTRRIHSGLADEMIQMAAEQFLPSIGPAPSS